jgi:hypothetical protein
MDQYELIRTGCRVYGKNISEMARMTGHSRNTIKKAIRGEPWGYKERSHQPFPVLDRYLTVIDSWLTSDKCGPKKQRHTARRVYFISGVAGQRLGNYGDSILNSRRFKSAAPTKPLGFASTSEGKGFGAGSVF